VPLLEAGIIDSQQLIADAKSGISGAGRKANIPILMSETGESFKAYNVSGHRHLPEILQELQAHSTRQVNLTFVPHLVPMIRGIEATLYATLTRELTVTELHAILVKRYQNEPFIDILPPEAHAETRHVRGANLCQLAVHRPQNGKVVVILSVIDNLVKGASGQAVQNMNIMSSLPETMGLTNIALLP
jgi:N-acetyl-gamma-glutamyl-phosphate reductase